MLKDQDIIYFSNDWDADNKTSSHHIAEQLAKHNRLLYVESSGLRAPKSSAHDIRRIGRKIGKFFKGARKVGDSVYVFSPMLIPLHRFGFIRALNQRILVSSLSSMCRQLGFKNPIVWIVIPHMVTVIGKLQEKLVVYYCVDSFSSLPNVESSAIAQYDQELTKKADIIFTPSQPLYEEKKQVNANTFLSPHGVDVEHFGKVQDANLPIPEDIARIKKPIIGFFGLIEHWVDLKLIRYIAERKPEYSLVLIGRVAQDINGLKDIPNVYFLGPRNYEELPAYAKAFDVALLPYVLNKQVYNANPIKLREYLAGGKPVVSVTSPEIEKFRDVIAIADSYEDFVFCIESSLKENSAQKIKSRIDKVIDCSWEGRFDNIAKIVHSFLENK